MDWLPLLGTLRWLAIALMLIGWLQPVAAASAAPPSAWDQCRRWLQLDRPPATVADPLSLLIALEGLCNASADRRLQPAWWHPPAHLAAARRAQDHLLSNLSDPQERHRVAHGLLQARCGTGLTSWAQTAVSWQDLSLDAVTDLLHHPDRRVASSAAAALPADAPPSRWSAALRPPPSWTGLERRWDRDRIRVREASFASAIAACRRARVDIRHGLGSGFRLLFGAEGQTIADPIPAVAPAELCCAVWALDRPEREQALVMLTELAAVLEDRRQLWRDGLTTLGWRVQQDCLRTLVAGHDVDQAAALAERLAGPAWIGLPVGGWAAGLHADLHDRQQTDRRTLRLPTLTQWQGYLQRLPRPQRIAFLVRRLRLIRQPSSWETGEPEPQTAQWTAAGEPAINPFGMLLALNPNPIETIDLLAELENRQYCAIAAGGRFGPRRLLRVADLIADLLHRLHPDLSWDPTAYAQADRSGRLRIRQDLAAQLRLLAITTGKQQDSVGDSSEPRRSRK